VPARSDNPDSEAEALRAGGPPPTLSQILGQDAVLEVLRRAIAAGKLAQAYLFVGIEGVGKATTARALAAALSCELRPGEGCGTCASCRKLAEGTHPDLIRLEPEGASIKIDQVRSLEEHLGYPPHEGRHRVVLIDGADRFTESAANALLKSVEEPRPQNLFVLITAAIHRVVPTLVSRCQRVRFRPLESDSVLAILGRQGEASSEAARRAAAALAGGSAGRALKLLQSEQMGTIQETVSSLLRASAEGSVLPLFESAGAAGRDRLLLTEALDYLRVWLRDLLLLRESLEGSGRLINAGSVDQLRAESAAWTGPGLLSALRAVDETQRALRGNVHPTLALEHLGLRLHQLRPGTGQRSNEWS
jgi:DNA polymerase-3 subunit delta'